MRALALALLVACGAEPEPVAEAPVEVRAWLDGVGGGGGTLVVQTVYDPTGEVDLPEPEAEGLTFEQDDEPLLERIGDHEVVTQRFSFTGSKGSYEIRPQVATWHGEGEPETGTSASLFVDLGVPPPREAEPEDIVEPARVFTVPWGLVSAAGLGAGVLALGLWVAFGSSRKTEIPEAPPEPPDVVALRAWKAVRGDTALDDHAKAQRLSLIFRTYAEDVLAFPAASWTTTEILAHLQALKHLPEGNVPRARRLLRATDRVKYAEQDPEGDFFEELDADLRAFVDSTRPRRWSDDTGAAA